MAMQTNCYAPFTTRRPHTGRRSFSVVAQECASLAARTNEHAANPPEGVSITHNVAADLAICKQVLQDHIHGNVSAPATPTPR